MYIKMKNLYNYVQIVYFKDFFCDIVRRIIKGLLIYLNEK